MERSKVLAMSLSLPEGNCWLAHDLNNKLAIVLGYCELLMEVSPNAPDYVQRLRAIQSAARSMAEALKEHQCELSNVLRQPTPVRQTHHPARVPAGQS
jgi:hypothetical protein